MMKIVKTLMKKSSHTLKNLTKKRNLKKNPKRNKRNLKKNPKRNKIPIQPPEDDAFRECFSTYSHFALTPALIMRLMLLQKIEDC
jgi:hypothetical protein